MFQSWRLKVREGEEALKAGQLDEARRLVSEGDLVQYLPGKRLAVKVAAQLADRARHKASQADLDAGWRDLEVATALGVETRDCDAARQFLSQAALGEVQQLLQAGDPAAALARLDALRRNKAAAGDIEPLRQVAQRMQSADNLCRRGKFADAESQLAAAAALRSDLSVLEEKRQRCRQLQQQSRELTEQLHRAMADAKSSDALALADQLLELAPDCRLARDARRRAWAHVGANFADSHQGQRTQPYAPRRGASSGELPPAAGSRLLLWIDGVGGFLVCLADEVVIGQSVDGNTVDVPILGDLSRRHARIRREGEDYLLEPLHAVRLNGRPVQGRHVLDDGDEIELGAGVRLRFRRPHALSASARLDVISRHRTQPLADGVLLMAESCVLGPRWQNHVVCRDWASDVVLYRQDDGLFCRAMESIEIDGALCDGRGRLDVNSHVVGSDFSMSLEELDRCSTQPLL